MTGNDGGSSSPDDREPEVIASLRVERLVAGGLGLAREPGGRVVLVRGALPGDVVVARVVRRKRDVVHAEVHTVVEPSPPRVEPPCPYVAAGCGGCDLQHADPAAQVDLRVEIVRDALRRGAGLVDPSVQPGPWLEAVHYRTTVRCLVAGDRAAWRARASHRPVPVHTCLVAHPLVDEVLRDGRFPGAHEITIRAGVRTGERLVVVEPGSATPTVPDGVIVVGGDGVIVADGAGGHQGSPGAYHEVVTGRRWRISARSFFQPSVQGADALVATVSRLGADRLGQGPLVDLYGGIGLFAGSLAGAPTTSGDLANGGSGDGHLHPAVSAGVHPVVVVEQSQDSVRDARHNLGDLGDALTVRAMAVERWQAARDGLGAGGVPAGLVIADPPREGLGAGGVAALDATGTDRLVLVSCDAAALGRDARLLHDVGFRLEQSVLVNQFGMTSHVEVVTRFVR